MSGGGTNQRPSGLRVPSLSSSTRLGNKMTTSSTSLSNSSGAILTEDTDAFIIGNRVWVGGTKAGVIQYIGETQFAPGMWAGVVLDEPVGKNNGSVAGVQYFQCEPKRGVFSRLTKLSREPVESLMQAERQQQQAALDGNISPRANGSVRSASPKSQTRSSTPSGDWTSSFRIGERVQVTSAVGIKNGTLRYLGTTNFALGEWAGIELDNATGKNDGAVEGTRYFNCPMKYGLFAPVHKVTKPGSSASRRLNLTAASPSSSPRRTISSTMSPRRIGSQESISTIGSASKVTATRGPRLGVNSLTSTTTKPSRSSAVSVTATHTAMQEALKEKEQHIQQLMKERDMERAEVVRAAAQVDEAERELSSAKTSFQKRVEEDDLNAAQLRDVVAEADKNSAQLQHHLDEERKKVEDLQFRLEEEAINKSDMEKTTINFQNAKELDAARIRELEELLSAERSRAELLEHESNLSFQGEEELLAKHLDEIEDLKVKLTQAEDLVKSLEATKVSEGCRASQAAEDLVTLHESRIVELEDIVQSLKTAESDAAKNLNLLRENERNVAATHEAILTDLEGKVRKLEYDVGQSTKRAEELQMENSELRRGLQATQENFDSVFQQKEKLEAEINQQMKSSGDNSTQLIKISEELRDKQREVESFRLREQTTRQQSERLEEVREQLQGQHQREVEALGTKHWEEIGRLEESVRAACQETEKLRVVCVQLETDRLTTSDNHDVQLAEWKRKSEEQGHQVTAITAQLEEALKAGDAGRRIIEELKSTVEQHVITADAAIKEKSELVAVRSTLERDKIELEGRLSRLETERAEHGKAVSERDTRLGVLNAEVDRLRAEFDRHRVELQRQLAETTLDQETVLKMRSHLELQQMNLDENEERLRLAEEDKLRLQEQVARAETVVAEKSKLEAKVSALEKQLEDSRTSASQSQSSHEDEKDTLQKMLQATQTLLEQRELEVSCLQEQMSVKSADALVVAQRLREDKARLEAQLAEQVSLSRRLSRSSTPVAADLSSSTTDLALQKLAEDKEAAEAQIDFLNSVIVDMQRKNDDLASRINVLEIGDLIHGSSDVNLNSINASAVPPRLFCDICDAFDEHDTEDCPKQETSTDGPPPTQYHGTRHQERPYCDICEVFGHWTNECDDNETF